MDGKIIKTTATVIAVTLFFLVLWFAKEVFLVGFSAILLAILLNTLGRWTQMLIRVPYPLSVIISIVVILGILTLTFWLYSPLIADQLSLLAKELPSSVETVKNYISPFLRNFVSNDTIKRIFSLNNEKIFNQAIAVFSFTVGSMINFIIFLIIGLYLALTPQRYISWFLFFMTPKKKRRVWEIMSKIGKALRWWLIGKLVSMSVIGIMTFTGLRLLNVSLAFILGLLSALLTFIPYVGAILSAIPAILIAFTKSPLTALYVAILYLVIHMIEGYMITPYIEQKTVSIPPALTIFIQMLMLTLIGVVGFALATPLAVLAIALIRYSSQRRLENRIQYAD